MCGTSDSFRAEDRGTFIPKYMRNPNAHAQKPLIFVLIPSTTEAGIEKVYNKIALVHFAQNLLLAVTN